MDGRRAIVLALEGLGIIWRSRLPKHCHLQVVAQLYSEILETLNPIGIAYYQSAS
jgi:hypothetical protein